MTNSYSKYLKLVLLILISLAFMTWIAVSSTAQPSAKKPVKIGILTPLSPPGDVAGGKRLVWGAELAIKYINEEMGGVLGGRPVELVTADDQGTPAEGIAGFRRLVQKDGVVAVMGQIHSSVAIAVAKISNDLEVPLFSTTASTPKFTETHYPTIFSIMSLIPDRSEFWISFAKKMGYKRVALLGEDTDYGTGFAEWVKKYGQDAGVEVKTIIFPRAQTDLTPALLETKAWKPDFLINIGVGTPGYLMVSQAFDIGLFPQVPQLASYEWTARPEFWDAVGDKGKYILNSAYYKPGMRMSRLGDWMVPRYLKQYNEYPSFYELNAFGEVLVIAQATNLAQSDNPKSVTKALSTGTFTDWSGEVKFEELPGMKWHNVSPPLLIVQVTKPRQSYADAKLVWPPKFGGDGKIEHP